MLSGSTANRFSIMLCLSHSHSHLPSGGVSLFASFLLAWGSHKCVTNLFCDVSLLCRIALRCVAVLSSTGFSLCTVNGPQLKPHRLKPVLLDRAGPALSLLAVNPAGNVHRVQVRNAD